MKDAALALSLIACILAAVWIDNHPVEITLPPSLMRLIDPTFH